MKPMKVSSYSELRYRNAAKRRIALKFRGIPIQMRLLSSSASAKKMSRNIELCRTLTVGGRDRGNDDCELNEA
jgi:hypothetical protein